MRARRLFLYEHYLSCALYVLENRLGPVLGPERVEQESDKLRTREPITTAAVLRMKATFDGLNNESMEPPVDAPPGPPDREQVGSFKPSFEVGHGTRGHGARCTTSQARRYEVEC